MNEELQQVERWRRAIALSLAASNLHLTPLQVHRAAQSLIIGILCLHGWKPYLLTAEQVNTLHRDADIYAGLHSLLREVGDRHGLPLCREYLAPDLHVEDGVLRAMMTSLGQGAIAPALLGQIHEQSLSQIPLNPQTQWPATRKTNVRKTGGSYYTPADVVTYIVHATLGRQLQTRDRVLFIPRILDPACGGGAFLLAAYRFLLDWQLEQYRADSPGQECSFYAKNSPPPLWKTATGEWRLTYAERERLLLHHIYGVDIDPDAIAISRLALLLTLLEGEPSPPSHLPDLSHNLRCGNALIGLDFYDHAPGSHGYGRTAKAGDAPDSIRAFDWETAFPNVMATGGFDVVLGNPPYIDSEGMTLFLPQWRRYCTTHYQSATGNWDIFCPFIEKALTLCKPGGLTSFVVPNKLASADYAAGVRSLLIHNHRLLSIRDYSRIPLFAAGVYPLVFVAQSGQEQGNSTVYYERMEMGERGEQPADQPPPVAPDPIVGASYAIDYQTFADSGRPWLMGSQPLRSHLMLRLRQDFPLLGDVAQVTGAATVAEAYGLQALIQEQPTPDEGDLKVVNSGTLDRYSFLWGKKRLRYLGTAYLHPVVRRSLLHHLPAKRYQQAIQPKIIVAGMTRELECALDAGGGVLAAKSTSVIRSTIDLRYLLGLLNSRLVNCYFTSSFGGNSLQGGYLRIGPPQLKQIPIRLPDLARVRDCHCRDRLIVLVNQRLELHPTLDVQQHQQPNQASHSLQQQIGAINQAIDQIVYELYGLSDAEIAMVGA